LNFKAVPALLHREMLVQNLWSLLTVIRSGFAALAAPKALVSFGTRGTAKSSPTVRDTLRRTPQ
jgi:hypothetical protein